jgi:hypothetical protein
VATTEVIDESIEGGRIERWTGKVEVGRERRRTF